MTDDFIGRGLDIQLIKAGMAFHRLGLPPIGTATDPAGTRLPGAASIFSFTSGKLIQRVNPDKPPFPDNSDPVADTFYLIQNVGGEKTVIPS